MTKDDIVRMAREVLLLDARDNPNDAGVAQFIGTLSDFAVLVAKAERDRIATEAQSIIKRTEQRGAEIEREACAKAAEHFLTSGRSPLGRSVAAAIRARGST
jgi:hypothetical protein